MSEFESNAAEVVESIDNEAAPAESSTEEGTLQEAVSDVLDGDAVEASAEESEESKEETIKELRKKLKLKVDGEEIEEEIDFEDDESLKKYLQKAKAFDKRSQELASLKGQVDQFVKALRENPVEVLRQAGHDVDALAEGHIQSMLDEASKSPEQLAQEKLEAELKALKDEKEQLKKSAEEAEMERLRNQQAAEIEGDISSALDSAETVLPKKNPWVMRKVAETMLLAMQNGRPDITAKEVIPLVENQFINDLQEMFDVFPEEVIEKVVKKQNLDRVRKKRVKNRPVNTKTAKQVVKPTNSKGPEAESKEKKKSYKDFFDYRS